MNEVDIDGIQTKVSIQCSWGLGGPVGAPASKAPNPVCSIYPTLGEFKKLEVI